MVLLRPCISTSSIFPSSDLSLKSPNLMSNALGEYTIQRLQGKLAFPFECMTASLAGWMAKLLSHIMTRLPFWVYSLQDEAAFPVFLKAQAAFHVVFSNIRLLFLFPFCSRLPFHKFLQGQAGPIVLPMEIRLPFYLPLSKSGCLSRVAACLSIHRQQLCLWSANINTGLALLCNRVGHSCPEC